MKVFLGANAKRTRKFENTGERSFGLLCICVVVSFLGVSCGKVEGFVNPAASASNSNSRFLYVASGSCYGGGVATSTGLGTIAKFDTTTGALVSIVIDYNTLSPGDLPAGLKNYDSSRLIAPIENGSTARHVDLINKNGLGPSTYLTNATAFASILRGLTLLSDGGILIPESASIEKFNSSKARMGAPFITAPTGACATSTTLMNGTTELPNGKILFVHALANQSRTGMISSDGLTCLTAQTSPIPATALASGVLYTSSGKVITIFGSTTAASNLIMAYDLDITANVFSGATTAFASNTAIINGPSAITEDTSDGTIYVANGINSLNTIEKFTFNSSSKTLTRVGTTPFVPQSAYTRCISGMVVAD